MKPPSQNLRWTAAFATMVLLYGGAIAVGISNAQSADPAPPTAFHSSSERALPILNEIKQVLERIDARLQRIEQQLERGATAPVHVQQQQQRPLVGPPPAPGDLKW